MAAETPQFMPVPEGMSEITDIPKDGGIVALTDGALMLAHGGGEKGGGQRALARRSDDGGLSWGEPYELDCQVPAMGMIRLQSGALGVYGRRRDAPEGGHEYYFTSSADEGQTWTPPALISDYPDFIPMFHSLIQLRSGRLLLTGYWEGLGTAHADTHRHASTGWGLWKGLVLFCEGHRAIEMGICACYLSDDEGRTWQRAASGIIGGFDRHGEPSGDDGIVDLYEPTCAETTDGRVLMIARSKTGRLAEAFSLDGGDNWLSALPTELASSQSPAVVVSLPRTGDLLILWNQVSGAEIRHGFLRGRLSCALSRDSGRTWGHFRTLELQEGMESVKRIQPELPIPRRIVGQSGLGQLPDGFAMFTYPNVDVAGDRVFIRYSRMWPVPVEEGAGARDPGMPTMWPDYEEREATMTGVSVTRICSTDFFYEG